MGIIRDQFLSVVEWEEEDPNELFHKFEKIELKNHSRLIIRPGQCAIFLDNGAMVESFMQPGNYDIETQIVPVLSNLKGFKYLFDTGQRAEILFINIREVTDHWGTKQPILLPSELIPGGMPIRANGGYQFKIADYNAFITSVAGIKEVLTVSDVKTRIMTHLNEALIVAIATNGKDAFNIQAKAPELSGAIVETLNKDLNKIGIQVTGFQINSVSYPEEVQSIQNKAAGLSMIKNPNDYMKIAMAEGFANGDAGNGGGVIGTILGLSMAQQMMNGGNNAASGNIAGKFCSNCGAVVSAGARFCSNCGAAIQN